MRKKIARYTFDAPFREFTTHTYYIYTTCVIFIYITRFQFTCIQTSDLIRCSNLIQNSANIVTTSILFSITKYIPFVASGKNWYLKIFFHLVTSFHIRFPIRIFSKYAYACALVYAFSNGKKESSIAVYILYTNNPNLICDLPKLLRLSAFIRRMNFPVIWPTNPGNIFFFF